jgi:PAS domain S-box-containing protein
LSVASLPGWFQRLSIKGKLVLAFGLQLTLVAGVAVGGLIGLRSTRRYFESAIQDGMRIQRLAGEMRAQLLEARREEKDFLLRWRPDGYQAAHARHVSANQDHVRRLTQILAELEALGEARRTGETHARILENLVALKPYINVYAQDFKAAVELIGQREAAASELDARLSEASAALEEQVRGAGGEPRTADPLMSGLSQLRQRERAYLARGDPRSRSQLTTAMRQTESLLSNREMPPPTGDGSVQARVRRYLTALDDFLDLTTRTEAKLDDFHQAAIVVEPLVADIARSGERAAAWEIAAAGSASRQTVLIVGLSFLAALLTGVWLASRLARQIRTPLLSLARAAEAVGAGDLGARAEVPSLDEIGKLAGTFNAMTGRLRGLVDSLEQRVQERKRAEDALRASQRRLQDIVDNSTALIYVKDPDGRYLLVNRRFEEIVHGRRDELVGKTDYDVFPATVADAFRANDALALRTERAIEVEELHPLDDGLHTYLSIKAPLRDESGQPYAVCAIATDITERKLVEEQLRQSQKMEAIGRLAGGIAHDFNNLLTVINGFSGLMLGRMEANDRFFSHVSEIAKSGEKAAALTRQLLAYSRKQRLEPRRWDPNVIVAEMGAMLRRLIGEHIELSCELAPEVGAVRVDRGQFEQILLNLAVNARDAMPGGGRLAIRTENVCSDRGPAGPGLLSSRPPGPQVLLAVSDTGCGMTDEVRARIFEPFYTTKEMGRGTGLGLSVVYGVVQQSGGTIAVESTPGVGTTFSIFFPREVPDSQPEVALPAEGPATAPGCRTILLVEDEESVRHFATSALEEGGYVVIATGHAQQALQARKRTPVAIDLVVADLVMPDMGGRALVDQLRREGLDVPVLYISGYADQTMPAAEGLADGEHFLAKPFDGDDLLREIRRILLAPHS